MKDYVIVTDSSCDLPLEYVEKRNIKVVNLKYRIKDQEYISDLGFSGLSPEEFYGLLANENYAQTSQPNIEDFKAVFEPILKEDKDVLYVGLSSGISGTMNSAYQAHLDLKEKYPQNEIKLVDSLTGGLGLGLLVDVAYENKEKGLNLLENEENLNEMKFHIGHFFTFNDLLHAKNGGRLGTLTYLASNLLHIKSILSANNKGQLKLAGLRVGRKKSLKSLVKRVVTAYDDKYISKIFISHANCLEEATKVKKEIEEKLNRKVDLMHMMGTTIGSYGGPGTIAVFFGALKR